MGNTPRNSDGTIRRADKPKRVTNRSLLARWIEAEALHLRRLGMSYQGVVDHLVAVAQGRQGAMVPVGERVLFPADFRISLQAVHKACRRAILRLPNVEAAEFRKLDNERLDEMYLSLQPGIRQGDARSIEVGVRVLVHKAALNGYIAPSPVRMTGTQVNVIVGERGGDTEVAVDLNRLTIEELREYRRLEAKARGLPEVVEIGTKQIAQQQSQPGDPPSAVDGKEEGNGEPN